MSLIVISLLFSSIIAHSPIIVNILIISISLVTALQISISWFSWFRAIIFLIYIGGILVIFIYFSSLIPNQSFNISKISIIFLTIICRALILNKIFFLSPENIKLSKESVSIYSRVNIPLSLFLILFLFIILIVVVKIRTSKKSPIRPFS